MSPRVEGPYGRPTPLKKDGPQVLLIDFDGTVCEHQWPEIGAPMKNVERVWKRLYDAGHTMIVWTARSDSQTIAEAQDWLAKRGMKYHGWNALPEPLNSMYGPYQSRKVHGDVCIDDHALGGLPSDWEIIYDVLVAFHGIPNTRTEDETAELFDRGQPPSSGGLT